MLPGAANVYMNQQIGGQLKFTVHQQLGSPVVKKNNCDCMEKANLFWKEAEKETKIGFKLFHLEKITKVLPLNNSHTRDMPGAVELATKTIKLMSELSFHEGFIEPTIIFSS